MQKIATVTVGAGGATSISFSSIPSTFTDLVLVVSARMSSSTPTQIGVQLNGTTSGYTYRYENGTTSSDQTGPLIGGTAMLAGIAPGTGYTANTFSSTQITIPNYTSSTNKSSLAESFAENNASVGQPGYFSAATSNVTATVSSLAVVVGNGASFVQDSAATLYGIAKGSGGASVA